MLHQVNSKQGKIFIIINKAHSLLPEQEKLINALPAEKKIFVKIPEKGLTKEQQELLALGLSNKESKDFIVFVSPIPLLLANTVSNVSYRTAEGYLYNPEILLFHNDKREKKELPNGRIVMVVARDGWELVHVA